jgi:hypothetical protein
VDYPAQARLEGHEEDLLLPPTSTLVSSISNSLTFPLRLLSTNRVLNDLNQDSMDVWLLRTMELSALEAALEEWEQK